MLWALTKSGKRTKFPRAKILNTECPTTNIDAAPP
jgi:hypothetical protein